MATFTSTLPDELLQRLTDYAKKLSLPKNKLMENALNLYLEHLKRAEYVKSYGATAQDEDILAVAEEGMDTYLKQIEGEAG
ncbi:ribbon-helix-helix domain-containing protein [Algoriphagus aestuariicola]|uniref:Ribbon-helix-helix domain-containing protein n=1 Tax=Algoriphagus aestuariicola TaxID=1852016 RepID=A0ABS3BS64_9BACT|nr:ribbon-helix-helix domain-containing protein [Algoriphagus aestuariicola]MBN7801721.1 ribbon-helix-helix domain-containing protein [Algoriphagus aestuariicola]